MGARCYDYLISPVVQWDRVPPTTLGQRSPGVKSMFISRRIENMDVKAAEKAWREHRIAAEKYHCYATRYVQNGVIAALTPDAPVWQGCAELFYPTLEDLEQRFVGGTDRGRGSDCQGRRALRGRLLSAVHQRIRAARLAAARLAQASSL